MLKNLTNYMVKLDHSVQQYFVVRILKCDIGVKNVCFTLHNLQSELQEYQTKAGKMEAELQKANNKVCNMGHMLSQLSIKVMYNTISHIARIFQYNTSFFSKYFIYSLVC